MNLSQTHRLPNLNHSKELRHLLLGPDNRGSWKKKKTIHPNYAKSTYLGVRDEHENFNTRK